MSLSKALQVIEESIRRPRSMDDSVLLAETDNAIRQAIAELNPVTLAGTLDAIVSQIRQIMYGTDPGQWSDVPPTSLSELLAGNLLVMDCLATVVVGDFAFQSPLANNTAVTATSNTTIEPVLGLVTGKPTSTKCLVLVRGLIASTLGRGKVFVGTDGKMSLSVPALGYIQHLGVSLGNSKMVLQPSIHRTLRA